MMHISLLYVTLQAKTKNNFHPVQKMNFGCFILIISFCILSSGGGQQKKEYFAADIAQRRFWLWLVQLAKQAFFSFVTWISTIFYCCDSFFSNLFAMMCSETLWSLTIGPVGLCRKSLQWYWSLHLTQTRSALSFTGQKSYLVFACSVTYFAFKSH